ncbi:transposase, partial [Klebsiella pneumoniae]|uniref:transposase n=1 Tax=Klebsiella pneumoniae TaxID=573 RepID=UPI0020B154C7
FIVGGPVGDFELLLCHGTVCVVGKMRDLILQLSKSSIYSTKPDDGYTGVEKRSEHADREVIWQVAARRSTYKMLDKRSALYKAKRKIEKAKAQVRAKVEPPFRVIKRQFGYTKVRFRGLVKNTAQLVTLFALSNLWMARRHLLASAGEVRL